jgi:hypothetical protein
MKHAPPENFPGESRHIGQARSFFFHPADVRRLRVSLPEAPAPEQCKLKHAK